MLAAAWALAILFAGAYLRLHRLDEEGVTEEDSVGYYMIAKLWTEGDYNLWWDQFHRPVVYLADAAPLISRSLATMAAVISAIKSVGSYQVIVESRAQSATRVSSTGPLKK